MPRLEILSWIVSLQCWINLSHLLQPDSTLCYDMSMQTVSHEEGVTVDTTQQYFTITEAAEYIGKSRHTLRRWESEGIIQPLRDPANNRMYTRKMLDNLFT